MRNKSKIMIAALATGVVISGLNVYAAGDSDSNKKAISTTIDILKKEAARSVEEMEIEINKVNKDTSKSKFNLKKAKSAFEDVVFLGDSITEYLRVANILDASSVLAQKGEHINQANKHLDEIKDLKPRKIIMLYGANDLNVHSPERYKDEYLKLVNQIKKVSPRSKIYIQAPLKVDESKTVNKDTRINNENVKLYTQKARQVANLTGSRFLSSDDLIPSKELFEQDGIHLKYDFYVGWLAYLNETI